MGGNIQGSFVPIKKKNRNYNYLLLSICRSTFLMKRILVLCDLFPYMFYVIWQCLFRVQAAHLLSESSLKNWKKNEDHAELMKEWYGLIVFLVLSLFEPCFKFVTPSLLSVHSKWEYFLHYLAKCRKYFLLSSFWWGQWCFSHYYSNNNYSVTLAL